ncbi:MAG: site-specific integrase [Anaerolineae bacterium]|nr:site-specific integrase [Anaerolineae bacterium]NPV09897.1 site-specific integrase [Anaerolineae bacterium]
MARRRQGRQDTGAVQLSLFGDEQAIQAGSQVRPPAPQASLRRANAWFAGRMASLDYSANTVESYTTAVELLARFLGDDVSLRQIRASHLRRYLQWLSERGRDTPVKTLALRVTGIRRFFELLQEEGVLPDNPAADLYAPGGEVPLPDVVTAEEQDRMRQVAWASHGRPDRPDSRPLLLLMLTLELGLRRGELEELSRGQVLTAEPVVAIRIHHRGRRHRYKNRTLPAPAGFREVYRAYLSQYPSGDERVFAASTRTLHRVLERLGREAHTGVLVTPNVMRWSCALRWYFELPADEVRQRLGLSPVGWEDALRVLEGLARRLDAG